jgi:hypothetical protein
VRYVLRKYNVRAHLYLETYLPLSHQHGFFNSKAQKTNIEVFAPRFSSVGARQRGWTAPPGNSPALAVAKPRPVRLAGCVSKHLLEISSVGNAVSSTLCPAAGAALHSSGCGDGVWNWKWPGGVYLGLPGLRIPIEVTKSVPCLVSSHWVAAPR